MDAAQFLNFAPYQPFSSTPVKIVKLSSSAYPNNPTIVANYLAIGLQHGIIRIFTETGSHMDVADFEELSEKMFTCLADRAENTTIHFQIERFKLTIEEIETNVVITVDEEKRILPDTSLSAIQKKLMQDMLKNVGHYPKNALQCVLNYLIKAKTLQEVDADVAADLAHYYAKHSRVCSEELKLLVINHVFHHERTFPWTTIMCIVDSIILEFKGSGKFTAKEVAKYIMNNFNDHLTEPLVLKCACLYAAFYPAYFSRHQFTLAAKHIVKHSQAYPRRSLQMAAMSFINSNLDFFTKPLIAQSAFVTHFQDLGELATLNAYSNKLTNAIYGTDRRNISVHTMKLWKAGRFEEAISKNVTIAIFLLENTEDNAIFLWNQKKPSSKLTARDI